jgi:DNA-binding transcriptional ArsR family regulator
MRVLDDDRLDETFAALANPTRRAIVARLAQGEASVKELAEPFAVSLPAISKHIKVLERAGIVVRSRRAQTRPCALRPEAVEVVADWVAAQRPAWDARLDRMGTHLDRIQDGGGSGG